MEGPPNPPLSLWSLFPGEELVTLTLGSGRGLEAALPRKPGLVTEGGCRGRGGVLGGAATSSSPSLSPPPGTLSLPKPLPPPVPAQGGRGHSLRDTWMSSVTLNTPEVTKLSWKSVVSGTGRTRGVSGRLRSRVRFPPRPPTTGAAQAPRQVPSSVPTAAARPAEPLQPAGGVPPRPPQPRREPTFLSPSPVVLAAAPARVPSPGEASYPASPSSGACQWRLDPGSKPGSGAHSAWHLGQAASPPRASTLCNLEGGDCVPIIWVAVTCEAGFLGGRLPPLHHLSPLRHDGSTSFSLQAGSSGPPAGVSLPSARRTAGAQNHRPPGGSTGRSQNPQVPRAPPA